MHKDIVILLDVDHTLWNRDPFRAMIELTPEIRQSCTLWSNREPLPPVERWEGITWLCIEEFGKPPMKKQPYWNRFYLRPGIIPTLRSLSQMFRLGIATKADREWLHPLIHLFKQGLGIDLLFVGARHTWHHEKYKTTVSLDFSLFWRGIRTAIVLDDSPQVWWDTRRKSREFVHWYLCPVKPFDSSPLDEKPSQILKTTTRAMIRLYQIHSWCRGVAMPTQCPLQNASWWRLVISYLDEPADFYAMRQKRYCPDGGSSGWEEEEEGLVNELCSICTLPGFIYKDKGKPAAAQAMKIPNTSPKVHPAQNRIGSHPA